MFFFFLLLCGFGSFFFLHGVEPITFLPSPRDQQVETPSLFSLGSRGMGPRSLLREVLGELSSSLSLGTGSTGAVDLLLVLF